MHAIPIENDGFLNTKDAAKLIGVSPATLTSWRSRDRRGPRKVNGPPFYSISGPLVVYKRSELLAWVEQFRRETGVKLAPTKPGSQPRPWE